MEQGWADWGWTNPNDPLRVLEKQAYEKFFYHTLPEWVAGLDGVELDYPYASSSPELFGGEDEGLFVAALRGVGEDLGLRFTRGSDAHGPADLDRVYGPAA
jgi:hypothetical protein